MLKKRYETEDDIPEAARGFYEQDSAGAWVLALEGGEEDAGVAQKKKMAEMRDNNRELHRQLKAMEEKVDALGDINPETIRSAMAALKQTKNEEELELVKSGKIDEVFSRRTAVMQADYEKRVSELNKQREELTKKEASARDRFSSVFLADQVSKGLDKKKLRIKATAKDDLISRAARTFKPTDDLDALAPTVDYYGADGKELTVESWLDRLVGEAPHLFEGGDGGGARPGGPGGKVRYKLSGLSPAEFTAAADEVNAGKAEWAE